MRFVPVDFRGVDAAIFEFNPSNGLEFTPSGPTIEFPQARQFSNGLPGGNDFLIDERPDNLEQ